MQLLGHSLFVHISHKMTLTFSGGGYVCCLYVSRLMISSAYDFKKGHDLVFLPEGGNSYEMASSESWF